MVYESCHLVPHMRGNVEIVSPRYERFHAVGQVDAEGKWRQRHPWGEDIYLQYIRPVDEDGTVCACVS